MFHFGQFGGELMCCRLLLNAAAVAVAAGWICVSASGSIAVAATVSQQEVRDFVANPGAILEQHKDCSTEMAARVRDLVVTDRSTLNSIIGLLPRASSAQRSCIGTGLGQAALALVATDAAGANAIQTALASAGNETAIAAFTAVTGQTLIGATTASGGGGGGGPVANGPPLGGAGSQGTAGVGSQGVPVIGIPQPGGTVTFTGGGTGTFFGGGTTSNAVSPQ
jgi:hypothetical protein